MESKDDSYRQLLYEFRKRDNYDAMFRRAVDELAAEVDFSWVKSCVALGAGTGNHEILFARRFLPNLQTFIAVEPDQKSAEELRSGFQDGVLPDVKNKSVLETTVENWSGVDNPVDVVLLFNVLHHVNPADRQVLYEKLKSQYLSPDGIVVLIANASSEEAGSMRLLRRLGQSRNQNKEELLEAGFRLVLTKDIKCKHDLSNPTDGEVEFIRSWITNSSSEEEIRSAIADIYTEPAASDYVRKISIFAKQFAE